MVSASARGGSMPSPDDPPLGPAAAENLDPLEDPALERVLREVPRGALALSALTVGLLLLAWILIYAFVFLPRGMVS
jgi:hypothetical protein